MRVGLISDTHIPGSMKEMPYQIERAFAGVDAILHSGDIFSGAVLHWLERIAPVYWVPGDSVDHAIEYPRRAQRHVLEFEGVSVGMVHMLIFPQMRSEVWPGALEEEFPKGQGLPAAVTKVFGRPVDVVVFGDTHYDTLEWHDGILFINSGSPTLPRQMRRLGTVGLLDIEDGSVQGSIVYLSDYTVEGIPTPAYH